MNKTLSLTDKELNIILFGLQKLPFESVNELIHNIVAQLQAQTEPAIDPVDVVLKKE